MRQYAYQHNARDVAKQEYELAHEHYTQICKGDDEQRYQDAQERREKAVRLYLDALSSNQQEGIC